MLRTLGGAAALLLTGAGLTAYSSTSWGESLGARPDPERLAARAKTSVYVDGTFKNPHPTAHLKSGSLVSASTRFFTKGDVGLPPSPPPVTNPKAKLASAPASGLRLTWLGHSTVIVELDGFRVLTDPVWGERASPSTLFGPERFHAPPLPLSDVGHLDAIVISHDHYDHLDLPTIKALTQSDVPFYTTLGVGDHLRQWGVPESRIHELDWWDEASPRKGLRLVATPSQHFSGRGVLDRDATLWCSWTLIGPRHRVFFSGDTGLTPDLAEIGKRHGPFDLTMLEIGAFHPSWGDIHLGSERAIEAFSLLGGGRLLPVHWGTFDLGLHPWDEPIEDLRARADKLGLAVVTPRIGEPFEPTVALPAEPWWRAVR